MQEDGAASMTEPVSTDVETQAGYPATEHVLAYEIFERSGRSGLAVWIASAEDPLARSRRKHAAFIYMYGYRGDELRRLFARRFEQ
jgi:hypothetical protein